MRTLKADSLRSEQTARGHGGLGAWEKSMDVTMRLKDRSCNGRDKKQRQSVRKPTQHQHWKKIATPGVSFH